MRPMDLVKIAKKEPLMTLLYLKKDGTFRKTLASCCPMMYDKATEDAATARDKSINEAKRKIYGDDAWRY